MHKSIVSALAVLAALTVGEARAVPLSYDLVPGLERAAGPPYRTGDVGFDIHASTPPDPIVPVGRLLVHLDGASGAGGVTPPDPDFPFSLIGNTTRSGRGAVVSFGLVNPPDPDFPHDITIDPCWDVGPLDGSTPVLQEPPEPDHGAGNTSFDQRFTVAMGDGSVLRMRAHFQIFGGQPFTFGDTAAILGNSIDLTTHLLLDEGGTPNGNNPLFTVQFTGSRQVPEPGTLTLFGTALLCLGAMGWRRKARKSG
jgi:hypothetical protein